MITSHPQNNPVPKQVKEPSFRKFKHETVRSEAALRKLLADAGHAEYYDLAASLGSEEVS